MEPDEFDYDDVDDDFDDEDEDEVPDDVVEGYTRAMTEYHSQMPAGEDHESFLMRRMLDKRDQQSGVNWYSWTTRKGQFLSYDYTACMAGLRYAPNEKEHDDSIDYYCQTVHGQYSSGPYLAAYGSFYEKPALDKFIGFLTDRNYSPWRKYADDLFPQEPYLVKVEGVETNVNTLKFRQNLGFFYKNPKIPVQVLANFMKAVRIPREYPHTLALWDAITKANPAIDPSVALIMACTCGSSNTPGAPWKLYFQFNGHSWQNLITSCQMVQWVRNVVNGVIHPPTDKPITEYTTYYKCDDIFNGPGGVLPYDRSVPDEYWFYHIMKDQKPNGKTYTDPFTGHVRYSDNKYYTLEQVVDVLSRYNIDTGKVEKERQLVAA